MQGTQILSYLKNDRVVRFAFFTSLLLLFFQAFFIILNYRNLPPLIPLYFQRPWGTDQIVNLNFIFLVPGITLVLILLNTYFTLSFYKESPLISRILIWGEVLFCLLTTIAIFKIILLVI